MDKSINFFNPQFENPMIKVTISSVQGSGPVPGPSQNQNPGVMEWNMDIWPNPGPGPNMEFHRLGENEQTITIDNIIRSGNLEVGGMSKRPQNLRTKGHDGVSISIHEDMFVHFFLSIIVKIDKFQAHIQRNKLDFCAHSLFLNDSYSDVKIQCQGKIFRCHKNILSIRSKYFEACLAHQGTKESESGIIEIADHPPEVIEMLLRYIYTSEIDHDLITMEFFMAVDKYDIGEDLRKICIEHLKTNVTINNAIEILARSYMVGCKDLKIAAFEFITSPDNRGKIVHDGVWKEKSLEAMNSVYLDPETCK